jgi:hypothetical protein
MSLWWELHDKYEEALVNHTQFETDEQIEQMIHIEEPPTKQRKAKKAKKKKHDRDLKDDL